MSKITIVWQRPRSEVWEADWVEYLFQNIPHTTMEDVNHDTFINNSVIVESIWWAPHHRGYVSELTKRNYNFGLIHLSDERCQDDISTYQNCKFVIRNYFRGHLGTDVMHFPLGWNSGFRDVTDNPVVTDRKYTWCFVGHRWDQNRNDMVASMKTVPMGNLYVAEHHGPRLVASDMSMLYRDAVFIPCPRGAISIDSFRVTESLEAGCIPVVERNDYWSNMYGSDVPFLQIDQWSQAPAQIAELISDTSLLEKYRQQCYTWWCNHRDNTMTQVTNLVKRTMHI
jgi:hypothetical protein